MHNYLKQKHFFKGLLLLLLVIISFTSCFKNLTTVTTVYENNFDDYTLKTIRIVEFNGPVDDIRIEKFNGSPVLGRFNNTRIELTVPALPAHTAIGVSFDLYIHDLWKNDLWKFTFDGAEQLLTGFSNDPTIDQSYPHWLGNGSSLFPAQSDAYNINLPGACESFNSPHGTSMYKIERTILHNGSTFEFTCSDAGGYFQLPCKRSWSIDNLKIIMIKN